MIRAQAPALWLFVSIFLILMVAVPSCSGTTQRTKTLQTTLVAVNAARDGFVAWDRQHQHELVEKATSKDDALLAIDAYHKKREPITSSFEVVYRAVAVAATQTDEVSLKAALAKAGELYDALKKLTGGG